MKQDFSHLKVLAISIHNIEKYIYYSEGSYYFDTIEAHLKEGMTEPKLVVKRNSFNSFETAFTNLCMHYPLCKSHLTFIRDELKNELKSLINNKLENKKLNSIKSRSWFLF